MTLKSADLTKTSSRTICRWCAHYGICCRFSIEAFHSHMLCSLWGHFLL